MERHFNVIIKSPQDRTSSGNVDVFYGNVDDLAIEMLQMYANISTDEQARADRFHYLQDKTNYVTSHYFLNMYLARSIGILARDLSIQQRAWGKPYIFDENIDFNLSHSKNFFAFGITKSKVAHIGVDIERVDNNFDIYTVIGKYIHPDEEKYICQKSLMHQERLIRFYEIWTRKEAFLKMVGIGLVVDLSKVNVAPKSKVIYIDNMQGLEVLYDQVYISTYNRDNFVLSVCSNLDTNIEIKEISL